MGYRIEVIDDGETAIREVRMSRDILVEESQLLHYASITIELVGILKRYKQGIQLVDQDQILLDKGIKFLDRALSGQMLVYGKQAKLAPDAESVEIYGLVAGALEQVDADAARIPELSVQKLEECRQILLLIKEGADPKQIDQNHIANVQSLFRYVSSAMVQKSSSVDEDEFGPFALIGFRLH